jgi:hypothetical protein
MITREKRFKLMKIVIITHLSTFGSKNVFDPKNYGF